MRRIAVIVMLGFIGPGFVRGESIPVPNFSFELPAVTRDEMNPFGALPFIDDWDETEVGLQDEFDQNTGVFLNIDPGSPDRISNAHLDRLAFMSSLVGNDLRQELTRVFEVGRSYQLTVAVGTSSTFPVGTDEAFEIALFYFENGVEQVIASSLVHGADVGTTVLSDVIVDAPVVSLGDAWAGLPIGILIRPSIDDSNDSVGEGFWNLDFVRLSASDPAMTGDVNCDGAVDHHDVVALAEVLMGIDKTPCHVGAANVNADMETNGLDIQPLIDLLVSS
ncbi:MAG: hypothetical protein HS101_11670 [Planctomycetia bacterium]|nr:hypothetical protein [Planctomycetia bacterium]MCC7314694.1 hypothetical protein [Planctomycetota bacterium]